MESVQESFFHFAQSVSGVGVGLFHAILSIFYAVLGFAQELMTGIIRLAQALVELMLNLVQSALGFVLGEQHDYSMASRETCRISDDIRNIRGFFPILANFFVIAILGGGYYWYTTRQQGGGRKKRV